MSQRKKEIIGQTGIYLFGTVMTQLIGGVTGVLTRRFLGPVQMGVWALLQVVVRYSNYSTVGTGAAASREIPFYTGKGDSEKVERIKNTFFTYGIASSVVIGALLCVAAFFLQNRLKPELYWGLLITAAILILQRFNEILITLVRA